MSRARIAVRRPRASAAFRFVVAALLGVGMLWAPGQALASCAQLPGVEAGWKLADAVFVGTVTSVANGGRWATVRVEEVWKGPDQPAEVVVRGGPGGNVATSVDQTYEVGTRYLFAAGISDGNLVDNSCSATAPVDTIDLGAIRPADVRAPVGGTQPAGDRGPDLAAAAGPMIVAGIVGVLLVCVIVLTRRREN